MSTLRATALTVACIATVLVVVNMGTEVLINIDWQPGATAYLMISTALGAWIIWSVAQCTAEVLRRLDEYRIINFAAALGMVPNAPAPAPPTGRPHLSIVVGGLAAPMIPLHSPRGCDHHVM